MRYHVTIARVPDPGTAEQDWFHDEEFDSDLTPAEITARATRLQERAAETPEALAERMTTEEAADLSHWVTDRPWSGFGDSSTVDPEDAYRAGHEAGYQRGLE